MAQILTPRFGSRTARSTAGAFALAALLATAAASPTSAGSPKDKAREIAAIRTAVARGELVPLPRILAIARARVAGEVVKTELESDHGRLEYEVKILTPSGRVREVELDARTGKVLKIEDD
jgi:uncharacterized membrane protein YkoI